MLPGGYEGPVARHLDRANHSYAQSATICTPYSARGVPYQHATVQLTPHISSRWVINLGQIARLEVCAIAGGTVRMP